MQYAGGGSTAIRRRPLSTRAHGGMGNRPISREDTNVIAVLCQKRRERNHRNCLQQNDRKVGSVGQKGGPTLLMLRSMKCEMRQVWRGDMSEVIGSQHEAAHA